MSNKEIESKLKELETRLISLEAMIATNHDLLMKMATFDKEYIDELKKKIK